jgi:hypothetical protein
MPSVVFATKRGRELDCGVPSGVVEVGAKQVRTSYERCLTKKTYLSLALWVVLGPPGPCSPKI